MDSRDNLRNRIKQFISPVVFRLGLSTYALPPRDGCVILTFHRIAEAGTISPFNPTVWNGSPDSFAQVLSWLRQHFQIISLDELWASMTGSTVLPSKALLLTFDDGYRDVYQNVFPLLKDFNMPAAVFVTTDVIDQSDMLLWTDRLSYMLSMTCQEAIELRGCGVFALTTKSLRRAAYGRMVTWLKGFGESERCHILDGISTSLKVTIPHRVAEGLYLSSDEIREMSRHRITFGSHTCSHPILSRLDRAMAYREIVESKERLEAILGQPVRYFAYPNGTRNDFTGETVALLREAGFRLSVTTIHGVNRLSTDEDDRFRLRRVHAGESPSALKYLLGLTGVSERLSIRRHDHACLRGASDNKVKESRCP